MKESEITQTIIYYLAKNSKDLKGIMPKENYFLVSPGTTDEYGSRPQNTIYRGVAVDILADLIDRKSFFGWYISDDPGRGGNNSNAEMKRIKEGDEIRGVYKVKFTDGGLKLWIPAKEVKKKDYLNILRTPKGFKQSAQLLGIEGDLEKITKTIYEI